MSLRRQSILAVTGVGVGLLTLVYVLGVQVGKRSAALRKPSDQKAGEDLERLPESLKDQLRNLERMSPAPKPVPGAAPTEQAQAATPTEGEPPAEPKTKAPEPAHSGKEPQFILQILATPDAAEAQKKFQQVKSLGMDVVLVKDKGLNKIKFAKKATQKELIKPYNRLKGAGFKPHMLEVD